MDLNTRPNRRLRCAIYTRKSSEEGLDMEFNSLDAQREACEAYIASQKSEGWVATRERYDDQRPCRTELDAHASWLSMRQQQLAFAQSARRSRRGV